MKTITSVLEFLDDHVVLSNNLRLELSKRLKPMVFKKGDLVLDANQISSECYFICSGILRTYSIKDGKEISENFCKPLDWVNSPKSFITRTTDIYYIDAVEDTKVFMINIDDFAFLSDTFPEIRQYDRVTMGNTFGDLMERITSMRFNTAHERYKHFKKMHTNIHHRIPLGMVASYLGITQETLSRIRAAN